MDLVNVLVERPPMECSVRPVMPCVFQNKEDGDLVGHCEDGREGDTSCETNVLSHRVEEPERISGRFGDWQVVMHTISEAAQR